MEQKQFNRRVAGLLSLFGVFCALFLVVLWNTQIVHGADYAARAAKKIARTETVEASRGSIFDRYGRLLVGNKLCYRVRLDSSLMGDDAQRNETLLHLLRLCREHGVESWTGGSFDDSVDFLVGAGFEAARGLAADYELLTGVDFDVFAQISAPEGVAS